MVSNKVIENNNKAEVVAVSKRKLIVDENNYAETFLRNKDELYEKIADIEDNLRIAVNKFWHRNSPNGFVGKNSSLLIEFEEPKRKENNEFGEIEQFFSIRPNPNNKLAPTTNWENQVAGGNFAEQPEVPTGLNGPSINTNNNTQQPTTSTGIIETAPNTNLTSQTQESYFQNNEVVSSNASLVDLDLFLNALRPFSLSGDPVIPITNEDKSNLRFITLRIPEFSQEVKSFLLEITEPEKQVFIRTNRVNRILQQARTEIAQIRQQRNGVIQQQPVVPPVVEPAPLQPIKTFPINFVIDETKVFKDHSCYVRLPYDRDELEKVGNVRNAFYADVDSFYNFYVPQFEETTNFSTLDERHLPNLYAFLTEAQVENRDEHNTIFNQHITLGKTLNDTFIDVLNERGEKVGERSKGNYFDKFGRQVKNYLEEQPQIANNLREKFSNILLPESNVSLIKDFNSKKNLFPYQTTITFSTDNRTEVAEMLKQTKLSTSLMKSVVSGSFPIMTASFETLTEEVQQSAGSPVRKNNFNRQTEQIKVWIIEEWLKQIEQNPNTSAVFSNGVILENVKEETNISSNPTFSFYKQLSNIIFSGKLRRLVRNRMRTFEELLNGKPAHNETLFYKVEKIDNTTLQTLQTFYLPNSNEIDVLTFVDTQIKFNKSYSYRISNFQLVIGNNYRYKVNNISAERSRIKVITTPSIKLLEIPVYSEETRVIDAPPLPPNISIVPYKGIDNKLKINLNRSSGEFFLEPINIQPEDDEKFNNIRRAQKRMNEKDLLFRADDIPVAFEVFRTTTKPKNYADFRGKKIKQVFTDVNSLSPQRAVGTSTIENLSPNTIYYYTFRSIDSHGNISNPTDVFSVELVNNDGVIYPLITTVNFEEKIKEFKNPTKSMKKLLLLEPSFSQKIIDEQRSRLFKEDGKRIPSIIGKKDWVLGTKESSVWGKLWKVRLRSKETGKKIDFNVEFTHTGLPKISRCENKFIPFVAPTTFTIGGTMENFVETFTLQLNSSAGTQNLNIVGNGSFTFPTEVPNETTYTASVSTSLANSVVTITNASGSVSGSNVTNINVSATALLSIGGEVFNYVDPFTLELSSSEGKIEQLQITSSGVYSFTGSFLDGSAYSASVSTPPTASVVSLTNNTGTLMGTDITNLDAHVTATYTVGGTITAKFNVGGYVSG